MQRPRYPTLAIVAVVFLSARASADSMSAYKFEVLQGLAQSSDTVISAQAMSVSVGERGDIYKETTDTRVQCRVTAVHLGPKELKGKTITVVFGAGDQPISEPSATPLLLLLKKDGENYRLSFYHRHGVFLVEDDVVQCAFEPKKKGLYWSYYKLGEIVSRIKRYSLSHVEMKTEIADSSSLGDGSVSVTFRFKNTGKREVLLLPPTFCFSSFWVKKIPADRSEAKKNSWWSVDHWEFIKEPEPLLTLAVGSERSFSYQIPFAQLRMTSPGQYRATFDYHPYQLSSWATKITEEAKQQLWLGVLRESRTISVRSADSE
jgi:hypothetical protein